MNATTLALVDPTLAQVAIEDTRRGVRRFTGSSHVPLDDHGWSLRLEWRAKSTPLGRGSMRGFLGIEHDVEITEIGLVSPDSRLAPLPLDFVTQARREEYAREIEMRLDSEQWKGGGL